MTRTDRQPEKRPTRNELVRQSSRKRRDELKASLRQSILVSAGELFLEKGYEGFSLRQVALNIGYSATTIYRYYKNKDDLLRAIVREGFTRFNLQLAEAMRSSQQSPLKIIEALGEAYVRFGLENSVYYQLMFMQRSDFLFRGRSETNIPMIDSFELLQQGLGNAIESGVMRKVDIETYSHLIWALVHGITSLAIANPERFTPQKIKNCLITVSQIMLRNR